VKYYFGIPKNIIEYVIAYGLHVSDFENIGCHSIILFETHGSFGIEETYQIFQT
jgi:hypothetical protein